MPLVLIENPDDPRIALYRSVTDGVLMRVHGLFVAEGRLVVKRLLEDSPFETVSLLLTAPAHAALEPMLAARPDVAVHVAPQALLNDVAGFNIHRGCLALGRRPAVERWHAPGERPARVVVLEAVSNADNVGGIFRSAAALGAEGVLLAPGCCDPLYRKAIRTAIGASLVVPFAHVASVTAAADALRAAGYLVAALTPSPDATPLAEAAGVHASHPRLALLAGAEGDGLTADALACADLRVRIPMARGVDSLNVNVAVGIVLDRMAHR